MSADTFNEIKTRLESVVSSIQDIEYDLFVSVKSNILKVSCEKTFDLQVFYGKDNYV